MIHAAQALRYPDAPPGAQGDRSLPADLRHAARGALESGVVDVVLHLLAPRRRADDAFQLIVAGAGAQGRE